MEVMGDRTWQYVIAHILNRLLDYKIELLPKTIWQRGWAYFYEMRWCPGLEAKQLGELAFNAGELHNAIDLWETINPKPEKYYKARSLHDPYPDKLYYLNQIKENAAVIRLWETEPKPIKPELRILAAVVSSYLAQDNMDRALDLIGENLHEELLKRSLRFILRTKKMNEPIKPNEDHLLRQFALRAQVYIADNDLNGLLSFMKKEELIKYCSPATGECLQNLIAELEPKLQQRAISELADRQDIYVGENERMLHRMVTIGHQLMKQLTADDRFLEKVCPIRCKTLLIGKVLIDQSLAQPLTEEATEEQFSRWRQVTRLANVDGLTRYFDDLDLARYLASLPRIALEIRRLIVLVLAQPNALKHEPEPIVKFLADFLRRTFQINVSTWDRSPRIPAALIGAAIENAGRVIDALSYYDWLERTGYPQERDYALGRLFVVKKKRMRLLLQDGRQDEADRIFKELKTLKTRMTMPDNPNFTGPFPVISEAEAVAMTLVEAPENLPEDRSADSGIEIPPPPSPPWPLQWEVGGKRLEITRKEQIIKIDNQHELAYAELDLATNWMRGGGFTQEREELSWKSQSWEMSVRIQSGTPRYLYLTFQDQEQKLPL